MVIKIHPTQHALDQFEKRIKPELPPSQRERMSNRNNVRRVLFSICNKLSLINTDSTKKHFEALFYRHGAPPLRLNLVIDVDTGTLITLWHLGVVRRKK